MYEHVTFERMGLSEAAIAHFAFVRLFTRVNKGMSFHVAADVCGVRAKITLEATLDISTEKNFLEI